MIGNAVRTLIYRATCRLLHQPALLRALGRLARRWPRFFSPFLVARHALVIEVLNSSARFSNQAHAPRLVAGPFVIGMTDSPAQQCQRAQLLAKLPTAAQMGAASAAEVRLRPMPAPGFDLVNDYLVPVVWAGVGQILNVPPPGAAFFTQLQHVGAHLLVGGLAPDAVQRRVEQSAAAVRARVAAAVPGLRAHWGLGHDDDLLARQVVGLLWVGHPSTVQAGVLMMQELLARPTVYAALRTQAGELDDAALRPLLYGHVLELLRFRPPFPLLPRDVPRATGLALAADGGLAQLAIAPGSLLLLLAAALFDPAVFAEPERYRPERWHPLAPDPALMFGHGSRRCVASEQIVAMLISALTGLLRMPPLAWATPSRWLMDGPTIVGARLRQTRNLP